MSSSQYSVAYISSPPAYGQVRVAFNPYALTAAPVSADPSGYKDALNPTTWGFKNLPSVLTYAGIEVVRLDPYTFNVTWDYGLYGDMNTLYAPNGVLLADASTLAVTDTTFTMTVDYTAYSVSSVGDRVARIQFDRTKFPAPPTDLSSVAEGSAMNPRTWFIEEMLPSPAAPKAYTIMSVAKVDIWTYDILTLEHFPRANGNQLRLYTGANSLKLANGEMLDVDREFAGAIQKSLSTTTAQAVRKGVLSRDLANAPVIVDPLPGGPLIGGSYIAGGTLVINAAGDYESMSGDALLKKLILRRLITPKGAFFHLPQYGAGLGVKETYTRNNLAILAKNIEQQVLLEPEVEQAKANVSYSVTAGALVIQVRARSRSTGQETALSMNLPIGAVQL